MDDRTKEVQRKVSSFTNKIILVMFLGAMFVGFFQMLNEDASENKKPDNVEIYVMAEEAVEKKLKAPRTAKFAGYVKSRIVNYEEGKYIVYSYVDAQNSFGALVRSNTSVELKHLGGDQWRIIDVKIK